LFKKVLIANRGEIALRIIRACKELGIQTVAVFSEVDEDSLHVRFADEAICIGPAKASESYLNQVRIIAAAEITNADAIHPGYGFLAENAEFGDKCKECNITFIGPDPSLIRKMGDKATAKSTMKAAGVPVVPGSEGVLKDVEDAYKTAKEVGFPLMLKATAGGGGRGLRVVNKVDELEKAYHSVYSEAKLAFGNGQMYMERFIQNPKHIEVQIAADKHGNVVHLGERECTIQRRHQKLLEEAPSISLTPEMRKQIGEASVQGCKDIGYDSVGTIEYLFDTKTKEFFFMEMNTRIQVEHCVTEEVYDVDLIAEMIRAAAGEKLSLKQENLIPEGHAIECRINAENANQNFMPNPGKITSLHFPGGHGVRIDSHIYSQYHIPPNYDSMIAKIIVRGKDREDAINKMQRALDEFIIEGVVTTADFHQRLLAHPTVKKGDFDTSFLDVHMDEVLAIKID
jgi:acetyl-CoA carboxylase biotin carboxylase subunit